MTIEQPSTEPAPTKGSAGLLGIDDGSQAMTLDCAVADHGRNGRVSLHIEDADGYDEEWRPRTSIKPAAPNDPWVAQTIELLPFGHIISGMWPPT